MSGALAFIGLGMMGGPMVRRLAHAGFPLNLHDLLPGVAAALATEAGAIAAGNLAEACAGAQAVILMLPNSAAVRSVCLGSGDGKGLADLMAPGSLIVDMSSSDPFATRELGVLLAARDLTLLDAPVSGGVRGAVSGTLAIMLGGDDENACDRARPALQAMGRIFRTGGLGSGHAIKAINNYLSAVGLAAACEAIIIAQSFGLEPSTMIDVVNASTGRNNSTENKIKPFVLSGEFRKAGFALDLMAKDIRTTSELASRLALPLQGPATALKLWEEASAQLGGGADHTEIFRYIEMLAKHRDGASPTADAAA